MSEGIVEIREMMISMVSDVASGVVAFAPKLIGALLVLLVGWAIARLVQFGFERSVRGGLDSLLERTGIAQTLERTAMTTTPTAILGRVLFWLIMILFIMGASEIIGLSAVTNAIKQILGYLPSVISASIILAAGIFLARFVANVITSGAMAANISYARGLGAVARISIVVLVGVVTVQQLGVDTEILVTVITVSVAAMAFGMALAFALGSRNVVGAILAGHYVRQSLPEGAVVEVAGERGVVEEIGPINTLIRDGERACRIPNGRMIEEIVKE
jgi:hypothetical protein